MTRNREAELGLTQARARGNAQDSNAVANALEAVSEVYRVAFLEGAAHQRSFEQQPSTMVDTLAEHWRTKYERACEERDQLKEWRSMYEELVRALGSPQMMHAGIIEHVKAEQRALINALDELNKYRELCQRFIDKHRDVLEPKT